MKKNVPNVLFGVQARERMTRFYSLTAVWSTTNNIGGFHLSQTHQRPCMTCQNWWKRKNDIINIIEDREHALLVNASYIEWHLMMTIFKQLWQDKEYVNKYLFFGHGFCPNLWNLRGSVLKLSDPSTNHQGATPPVPKSLIAWKSMKERVFTWTRAWLSPLSFHADVHLVNYGWAYYDWHVGAYMPSLRHSCTFQI